MCWIPSLSQFQFYPMGTSVHCHFPHKHFRHIAFLPTTVDQLNSLFVDGRLLIPMLDSIHVSFCVFSWSKESCVLPHQPLSRAKQCNYAIPSSYVNYKTVWVEHIFFLVCIAPIIRNTFPLGVYLHLSSAYVKLKTLSWDKKSSSLQNTCWLTNTMFQKPFFWAAYSLGKRQRKNKAGCLKVEGFCHRLQNSK